MTDQNLLQTLWDWTLKNASWLFSGVGVSIFGVLIGMFFRNKKRDKKQGIIENNINIKGNKSSFNSFEGANFGIITKEVHNDRDKKMD
ncbi:MAG: hypothetical protein FWD82_01620 [Defluviitaleaceae bacterium]|nr:hypothetical protein [Defluviitaleaceae bacterium]